MRNPWLDVPLADYEAHMAAPGIEQAQLLANILADAIERTSPSSLAVLGCAGGNGFERIPRDTRVVGVDINPAYVANARERFANRFTKLQLIAGDIQDPQSSFEPVDLIYAGLVLEYVDLEKVVARTRSLLTSVGRLVTVLQLPSASHEPVSPSPYHSVQTLGTVMRFVPPSRLKEVAEAHGYAQLDSRTFISRGGKEFQVQEFLPTSDRKENL